MKKSDIIEFFDGLAPKWDANPAPDAAKINAILDFAGVKEGASVLDVACGTGVLFPFYLARGVKSLVGVDISPAMIQRAGEKCADPRLTLLCADVEETRFEEGFDICMVFNALPHFQDPARLVASLAKKLAPGGRLTIAHSMSRTALDSHHKAHSKKVSMGLIAEHELAGMMDVDFDVDAVLANDEMYVVSGVRV